VEHQRNQPPSAVPVPYRKGLMEALEAVDSLLESQQAGHTVKPGLWRHNRKLLPWLPVDPELWGEHLPLAPLR